ncbi:AAA family ATPase [[Brevibacterium] frigoritolerans]|nr:AAA family ATPase [Peribacillus frigoritolerans]
MRKSSYKNRPKNKFHFDEEWIRELKKWNGYLIIISGPSGVGKTTISEALHLPLIRSVTTREIRKVYESYDFWENETFDEAVKNKELASIVCYGENKYGFTKKEWERVSKNKKTVVVVMSPVAYRIVKEKYTRVIGVFLTAPLSTVTKRLKNRDGYVEEKRHQSFFNNNRSKSYYHFVVKNVRSINRVVRMVKLRLMLYRSVDALSKGKFTSFLFPTLTTEPTRKFEGMNSKGIGDSNSKLKAHY